MDVLSSSFLTLSTPTHTTTIPASASSPPKRWLPQSLPHCSSPALALKHPHLQLGASSPQVAPSKGAQLSVNL